MPFESGDMARELGKAGPEVRLEVEPVLLIVFAVTFAAVLVGVKTLPGN